MKSFSSLLVTGLRLVFPIGLLLCQNLSAAVTLNVTPSAISNQYAGMITLAITGLTNGETVTLDKFLDANTNGVIDGGDLLAQRFHLTDGLVSLIGGKTNINVPGDLNPAVSNITTLLNFQRINVEHIAGNYLFKLSSPTAGFTPVTNTFNITNTAYAQSFTGQVRSNGTATAVANAIVVLLEAGNDEGHFVGGVVADNSGNYTINAAPGTYQLAAFKSNFVGDFTVSPVTLGAGVIVTTNVNVVPATRTISGRVADAANTNTPLPGIMVFFDSDEGLVVIGFTDTNGSFNVPVTASGWNVEPQETDVAMHGYVQGDDGASVDTVAGNVTGVNILLPKATALFYGSIKDDLGNPFPGFEVFGGDQNQYESGGVSDANGNYAMAALAGNWNANLSSDDPRLTDYVFSGSFGNITLTNGQAVRKDFVLKLATNHITGSLKDNNDTPISGVQIFANANINGTNYQAAGAITDGSGNYSLNVANGNWNVSVNCCDDCDDGLDPAYQCPNSQNVNISNGNGVANFTAQPLTVHLSGRVVNSSGNPIGDIQLTVNDQMGGNFSGPTDSNGYFNIGMNAGTWHLQLAGDDAADRGVVGPDLVFSNLVDGANITNILYVAQNVTAYLTGNVHEANSNPIAFVDVFANTTVTGTNYNASGETDGGGNYSFGVFNGTWSVGVSGSDLSNRGFETPANQNATVSGGNVTVNFTIFPIQPLQITTTNLPAGVIFVNYHFNVQASGGQPPYGWNIVSGSLPPGVNFNSGLIDGIPTSSGTFNFTVQVSDQQGSTTNQNLSLTINPALQITTSSLPVGTNGVAYSAQLQASGGQPPYSWSLSGGSPPLPAFLNLNSDGSITGTPNTQGTFQFTARVADANFGAAFSNLSITITGSVQPLQVTTPSLPDGTLNTFYSQPVNASGGQPPYSWSLAPGSAPLPPGLNLSSSGTISGTPTNSGTFFFNLRVTDGLSATADGLLSIYIPAPPLQITTLSLPTAQQGASYTNQLEASGGQMPYSWSLAPGSLSLPPNLSLSTGGTISGTAATNGTFFFIVRVTDGSFAFTNRSLSLTINPKPALTALNRTGNQFQLRLTGAIGQNYTVQFSTNLANPNWFSLLITNPSAASVTILDPNATNAARFYRAVVGP